MPIVMLVEQKRGGAHMVMENSYNNAEANRNIVIQSLESSMLVIAKKKIILPENRIIMESFKTPSLIKHQPVSDEAYTITASGILLQR